ncbi:MAG: NIPSNAP family protein [Rudaea sp.]
MINRREFVQTTLGAVAASFVTAAGASSQPEVKGEMPVNQDTIFELRQYTLRGGKREVLISMFEESFLAPLNAAGAHVVGTFRDLDDPDRFVWMRSFSDMPARAQALATFYEGPLWQSKKAAANATIVDSDNVLLLRPASPDGGFLSSSIHDGKKEEIIGARIHYLGTADPASFAAYFDHAILPRIVELGAKPVARLVTEDAANNFPRLPVRERERVFIWLARWPSAKEEAAFTARFGALSGWRDAAPEAILPALMRKPERLRLAPTATSVLR